MPFTKSKRFFRPLLALVSFAIVVLILWNTYVFFQVFKEEERRKMELWATGQKSLMGADENTDLELIFEVLNHNSNIPLLLVNMDGEILGSNNVDNAILQDKSKVKDLIDSYEKQNEPIYIQYDLDKFNTLYYGNSTILNKLTYYPLALVLIIVLFVLLMYYYYQNVKTSGQNRLWVGMAKETAHQIGTPLSSLMGWVEYLRSQNAYPEVIDELDKDIQRLQTITERFSKIGSEPHVEKLDIISQTRASFDYLTSRFSKKINFEFNAPDEPVYVMLNSSLHSWTIENLLKNSVDSMKNVGTVTVQIIEDENRVQVLVTDTGKGIPKKQIKHVFEPGFTTKKRGWGLGLSLTKRIVEEYHKGRIKVQSTEVNKGTTFKISLPKLTS